MCAALGDTPDLNKMPPELEDFPDYVLIAMDLFNCLPDKYTGGMEPIYAGKDYSSLEILYRVFDVEPDEERLTFRVIQFLDTRARNKAIRDAERRARKNKK